MKALTTVHEYRKLFGKLRHLRRLRLSRKDKIPFEIKRQYGRKRLEAFVKNFWHGGYVYYETCDYLYIPPISNTNSIWRLIEPYIPEQILEKFCNLFLVASAHLNRGRDVRVELRALFKL